MLEKRLRENHERGALAFALLPILGILMPNMGMFKPPAREVLLLWPMSRPPTGLGLF